MEEPHVGHGRGGAPVNAATDRPNPFVGPRSFRTGEQLFGRDHETAELLDLLIAERIVLVNSPSGAGKSSLLNAALLPRLRAEGFVVPSPMRVSQQLPPKTPLPPGVNRYVLSLLLCMEEERPAGERLPLHELLGTSLDAYLDRFRAEGGPASLALIVDQFEEVLTIDPTDRESRTAFFDQLAQALRSRDRWALFAMREEYVAALEPYAKVLPTRLATRYRLELLRPDQAMDAICRPMHDAGVDMPEEAAALLIRNLSLVRVEQPDGTTSEQPGHAVEPVQLQVVCRRLWASYPDDVSRSDYFAKMRELAIEVEAGTGGGAVSITYRRMLERARQIADGQTSLAEPVADMIEAGAQQIHFVHRALADYYADVIGEAAKAGGVSERAIREWVGNQLITEQGMRGQVPQQPGSTRGLDNRAIAPLVEGYLVRADKRRGLTWYELAHDRLVEPIRRDNARWLEAHLHPLQRQAALWASQARSGGLLLRAEALGDAERWAAENSERLLEIEREFLAECLEARRLEERERLTARQLKRRGVAAAAAFIASLALAAFAVTLGWRLVVAYVGIWGITFLAFGWTQPNFDSEDWEAALDAHTALARAASGTTAAQRDATTIVLEPTADESVRTGIYSMLRQAGFKSVDEPAAAVGPAPPDAGTIETAAEFFRSIGGASVALATFGSDFFEAVARPRLSVRYGSKVDPDIVRVVVYTAIRARTDVMAIEKSTSPDDAGIIRVGAASGGSIPVTLEAVEEQLPTARPDPIFASMLEMEPLARTLGVVTGRSISTRIAFQQFEGNHRMLWMQSDFDAHYVLEPPAPGERQGRWRWLSLADLPSDATERVDAFLRDSPDRRRTRFQANGGFLQLWLHNKLEPMVGWPVAGTCILGTSGGYMTQNFFGGKMVGPLPRYNLSERQYISGREFRQVHVLILFDDYTYVERDVPDPDSDADKYTEVSRLGESCNS